MVELKEIETRDEGGVSFVTPCLEPILPSESKPCLPDTIFALQRASAGPRRIDLCLGGINHAQTRDFFCRPLCCLVGHERISNHTTISWTHCIAAREVGPGGGGFRIYCRIMLRIQRATRWRMQGGIIIIAV
jgi:hypothetical protein